MRNAFFCMLGTVFFAMPVFAADVPAPLTLEAAIQKTLESSPRLKSFNAAKMAREGELQQAGAFPNPEIDLAAENFAGSGNYKSFNSAEVTYGVSQLVEIGGKRSARKDAAARNSQIAGFEVEAARLDAIRDVTIAYADAIAAKEAVALAEKQKSLATEVLKNVSQRVDAAAEPLFQKSKSEVALSTSEIALDKAQRDYIIARKQLAAQWGGDATDYVIDSSNFFTITPPDTTSNIAALKRNPDFVRWEAELARSNANLDLERANAIPDPSFNVGIRQLRDSDDRSFVAGLSFPIPVFNSNRGNIAKARHEVVKTESDQRTAQIALNTELTRTSQLLENAYKQSERLKEVIIPAAEKAYSLSRHGYGAGKFPYLEVLDAQRTLVEARAEYNGSLKEYHTRRAELERLTAKYLPVQSKEMTNE